MATWDRTEFNDELQALLNIQLPIGRKKIQALRDLAIKHLEHQNYLVQCVCRFIETSPPDYRIPGLYLVDAIVRRCKDKTEESKANEYRKRFFVVFKEGALTGLFHPCREEDKVKVDKVLNLWSEHTFPKKFVEQLKITIMQEPRRQPVVLPTNHATDIALQQQGWQPDNTPPAATPPNASPPVDTTVDKACRLPQGVQPQLPVNTLDFSNAVMHFLSVLNYGSLPTGMPQPNGLPMYGFPPAQHPCPYLSHPEGTSSLGESKEVHIKTEDIPTCAEQLVTEPMNTESTVTETMVTEPATTGTTTAAAELTEPMATESTPSKPAIPKQPIIEHVATAPTTTEPKAIVVKKEVMDTPFDRPPSKTVQSSYVEPTPPKVNPSQLAVSSASPTLSSLPCQASIIPPRTPPLPTKPLPVSVPRKFIQPPRTPPLPPQKPITAPPPLDISRTVTAPTPVTVKKPILAPQQVAPVKPVPPPKTPPLKSIPPPRTPPLPPQLPQKRLREPSPVVLPSKLIKDEVIKDAIKATSDNHVNVVLKPDVGSNATDKVLASSTVLTKPSRWDIKAKPTSGHRLVTDKSLIEPIPVIDASIAVTPKRDESLIKSSTEKSTKENNANAVKDGVTRPDAGNKASTTVMFTEHNGSGPKTDIGVINDSVKASTRDDKVIHKEKPSTGVTIQKDITPKSKTTKDTDGKTIKDVRKDNMDIDKSSSTKENKRAAPNGTSVSSPKRVKPSTDQLSPNEVKSLNTPPSVVTKQTNDLSKQVHASSNAKPIDALPLPKQVDALSQQADASFKQTNGTPTQINAISKAPISKDKAKTEKSSSTSGKPTTSSSKTNSSSTKDRSFRRDTADDRHSSKDYHREKVDRYGLSHEKEDRHRPRNYSRERDDRRSSREYAREREDRLSSRDHGRQMDNRHTPRDYSREMDDRRSSRDYNREVDDRYSSRNYDKDDRHLPRGYDKDDRHASRDYGREMDHARTTMDYDQNSHRYYSPQQSEQPVRSSPYSPSQPSSRSANPTYAYSRFARPGPISDPSLSLGNIRVLTRTLYVGPMSSSVSEDEVNEVFSRFGEVMSVIFAKRTDKKLKNAFVKFINRESLQAAKVGSDGITFRSRPVKVNWAHGFGPKHLFNYDKGESILKLNRLSDEDCASLKAAPVGGFQGSRLRDQVTVEEPGAFQQSTHREDHRGSPQYYQVQKFEETERIPQTDYSYYGNNDYGTPAISNPGYAQPHVEMGNGFYDQQANVYYMHEQQNAYYPPLYPTSGAAGQPQYYQTVAMQHQYQQLQSPATPPTTSQQFGQPQYQQYAYNNNNYAPMDQVYYFQQQGPGVDYSSDYRRQQ